MEFCGIDAVLLPSMFAIKNKIVGTPCYEDPSCIGYTKKKDYGKMFIQHDCIRIELLLISFKRKCQYYA